MNLLPKTSRLKKKVTLEGLVDLRTGEVMKGSTSGGAIFPLESSVWHEEKFLKRGIMQSGRLIHDGSDFFFAATFAFSVEEREPTHYMGVDRGTVLLAAYAVTDDKGTLVTTGSVDGQKLNSIQRRNEQRQKSEQQAGRVYRSRARVAIAEEEIHKTANALVEVASKHNALMVLEDLSNISSGAHQRRPKGRRRVGFQRSLTRNQYGKLRKYLDYKLQLEGFPPLRRNQPPFRLVRAAYTSRRCAECGYEHKDNRKSQEDFECQKCGHKSNADINASIIIAAMGRHFDEVISGRKKGAKLKDHEKFAAWYDAQVTRVGT